MSKLANAWRTNDAKTANGAVTHSTSNNSVLDMFFLAGASRNMSVSEIQELFIKAYNENKELALKCLFYARDVREGAGERRFFRICFKYLYEHNLLSKADKLIALKLLPFIPEFGRWDDLFKDHTGAQHLLFLDHISYVIANKDKYGAGSYGLLCKWLPRKGPVFDKLCAKLRWSPKKLRKELVANTRVVETQMCNNEWSEIEYSKVPSKAFNQYQSAYRRRDPERFSRFIDEVLDPNSRGLTVNADAIYPSDIYRSAMAGKDERSVEAQWISLPNYLEGSKENIIPVCDVSASMQGKPMEVAISLSTYIAERTEGLFKNMFFTFHSFPSLLTIPENLSITQKFRWVKKAPWGGTTNLLKTFQILLRRAVAAKLPAEEMPTKVLVISDMEFNPTSQGATNLKVIQEEYANEGYTCPGIIFWDVEGRMGNSPAKSQDKNVALVSGYSPEIVRSVLSGKDMTPMGVMLSKLNSERYSSITL